MAEDKRLETLNEEIKLLKGELKNSLTSVRDYLLNMELPSSEFSTILAALSGDGSDSQKVTMDGNMANPKGNGTTKTEAGMQEETEKDITDDLNQPPADEDLIDMEEPEDMLSEGAPDGNALEEEEIVNLEDTLQPEEEAEELEEKEEEGEDLDTPEAENEDSGPESEMPAEEEQPMEIERTTADVNQSIPKVNMLANLINWVARAKKEIGVDQLSTFLEVYGISGHLSLELKEVILHLAEITKEKSEPITDADIWSLSMLSLHGILTGGDAPLHPAIPSWEEPVEEKEPEEEIIEIDKSKDKPVKLKLVFPNGNGKNKEFCIDLTPDNNGNN